MSLNPGAVFHDRYLLKEMKGRGSFGEVWLAKDQRLDIDVAIKVYIALDTRGVEEFKSEFRTTFGLSHPNLLHANHFDICGDRPYLVMPFCPGSSMNLIGKMDELTAWRFISDVASGLDYLHGLGVVHHDIKPDNILINEADQFVITDFGISVRFRSTLRRNSSRQVQAEVKGGSMAYMAPEMFTEDAVAVNATDIWALGATLYELLTGNLPFFGQSGVMQLKGAAVPEVSGPFSEKLKSLVQSCLAKDSWDRPTAKQLVQCAQEMLRGEKETPTRGKEKLAVHKASEHKGRKKRPVIIAASVVALAVSAAVFFFLFRDPVVKVDPEPNPIVSDTLYYTNVYNDRYAYMGDVDENGVPNGNGVAVCKDYHYEGSFKDGLFDGYGCLDYHRDGVVRFYEGYFSNHQIDSGKLVSGNFVFEGEFLDMEYWNGIATMNGENAVIKEGSIVESN